MPENKLQKVLKPRHLWALAVGAVCSGNYYGFSYGFESGGPGSFLLALLPVTAMYVCFMACYMELAVSLPSAGGASEYVRRAMGGFAGFIAGFSVLVAYIVAPCAVAITTGQLLHYLLPAVPPMAATVAFFCLFAALIMYALVILSDMLLYRQKSPLDRPLRIPHPAVPVLALILIALLFICVLATNLSALKWVVLTFAAAADYYVCFANNAHR